MRANLGRLKKAIKINSRYKQLDSNLPNYIVILVPSPGVNLSETDRAKSELKENFGNNVEIIQIKCLENLKSEDQVDASQVEEIYEEILDTLSDRFKNKNLDNSIEWHILCYGQPSLVTSIAKPSFKLKFSNYELSNIITIPKVLSVIDTVGSECEKYKNVNYFKCKEDGSIPDYIDFLKKKQK
ncbi:MAG: hypothetical protein NMK33_00780 [Candidatus Cardinium sp.]|uniref:hypothetical protein n=1 Tax=Cardinium endosymbiont of Dermatophagoides farinae TaxID=2597823 RepID=UPI001183294B|nr:hypothetical protein [Cardinium endosymbiont of Dermatophagoides farinae]TSJ81060.1 hypothetical protein FPG78_03475 [Cardinium endosymbiont of Dermatophagoides farinae]UWW97088.1 MAG: hypothetical protein NMK33_00780 [Candidatus Cardinium sp.]